MTGKKGLSGYQNRKQTLLKDKKTTQCYYFLTNADKFKKNIKLICM